MWFQIKEKYAQLNIFAKPNAKKTILLMASDTELHISLHAKPHDGEANKELISYLSELFGLPKSQIILLRGENSRHKQVLLPLNNKVQELINQPENFFGDQYSNYPANKTKIN